MMRADVKEHTIATMRAILLEYAKKLMRAESVLEP